MIALRRLRDDLSHNCPGAPSEAIQTYAPYNGKKNSPIASLTYSTTVCTITHPVHRERLSIYPVIGKAKTEVSRVASSRKGKRKK